MRIRHIALFFCLFWSAVSYSQPVTREFRVALILPFNNESSQGALTDAMLDYYEGFRMACEKLSDEGLKLRLYVFDCNKDSLNTSRIFKNQDMKTMDMVVGPVYNNTLEQAELFCKENNILLVSPLKYYEPQNGYNRLINFFIPDSVRCLSVAEKCIRYFPGFRYYIVGDNSDISKAQTSIISKRLEEITGKAPRMISYSGGKLTGYTSADSFILISTLPGKEAKPLLYKQVKGKNAFVIAQMDWYNASMNTFGIDEPNLIYPEVNFVSYSDTFATQFRSDFFERYYGEPSKYAYIGYDQATYLCYGLMTFGNTFDDHLPDAEFRGLINVIKLKKIKPGISNIGLNYIRISEEEKQEYAP